MERLTYKDKNNEARFVDLRNGKGRPLTADQQHYVWAKRLAEYEETGLEPEEIAKLNTAENMRLTQELIDKGITPAVIGTPIMHLLELAKAEQEGKLIALPCKVGDTVYCITDRRYQKAKVISFQTSHNGLQVNCQWAFFGYVGFDGLYGETVFLTEEEAKAKVEEMLSRNEIGATPKTTVKEEHHD